MQPYLITTDEVSKLARTMSVHIDTEKIETYIRESENIDLKSALGDTLFLDVKDQIIIVNYSMAVLIMQNVVENALLWA